jgi:hypothetical protein
MRPFVTRASSVWRIVETVPSGSMIEIVSGDKQSMTGSSGERNLQCRELINELERQLASGPRAGHVWKRPAGRRFPDCYG